MPNQAILLLPNGCILRPGCRVRVPKEHINQIPDEIIDRLGLFLDDEKASPGSEVICMPYERTEPANA